MSLLGFAPPSHASAFLALSDALPIFYALPRAEWLLPTLRRAARETEQPSHSCIAVMAVRGCVRRLAFIKIGSRARRVTDGSFQVLVEPCHRLIHSIGLVFRFDKEMAFTGINDESGWYTQCPQRMPKFI